MKTCIKCQKQLPATPDFFYLRHTSADGFRNDCIECRKASDKRKYELNKESILAKNLAYREANRDSYNERVRESRKANPEHQKEIEKRRHEKHKEHRNAKYLCKYFIDTSIFSGICSIIVYLYYIANVVMT